MAKYNLTKKTKKAVNRVTNQYKRYANKYASQVNKQKAADIEASNAQYDKNAQSVALRNAVQQRDLQRSMYRNGITGGATESSLMNQANNYANQQGKIASDKVAAANTIKQKANADIAAFKLQNAQARDTAVQQARDNQYNKYQNWLKRRDTLNQTKYNRKIDKYNRYAQTVSGYDTVKSVNKAIRKIRKSGKGKWKIPYLKAQRAAVRERDYNRKHSK